MSTVSASSMFSFASRAYYGSAASSPARAATDTTHSNQSNDAATIVTLSEQAKAALSSQTNLSSDFYAQFFPTRDGNPATALALAVVDPGAQSSSAGKTLPQVGDDARARLDAKYAELKASGTPFDINSWEGKDGYTLLGDLDRRSLYAISSDQGGQFTDDEQKLAQSVLGQEEKLATGYYAGPTSLAGAYVPPNGLTSASVNPFDWDAASARSKALINYMDGVSDDEKSSVSWAYDRAAAQRQYEAEQGNAHQRPDNLDSDNPLAKLIGDALKTMQYNPQRGVTHGSIRTIDDLKSQPWFQGFESQLDSWLARHTSAR